MAVFRHFYPIGFIAFVTLSFGTVTSTQAYEGVEVTNGGTLAGSVKLLGDVPKPKAYNLVTFPDPVYCGRISNGSGWRMLQPFDIGPAREFRQAVVMVLDVGKGKLFQARNSTVEAIDCTFAPYVSVVFEKQPLQITNMDPVLHDIQAYETSQRGARVLFNSPLPMNPRYTKESISLSGRNAHSPGTPMTQRIDMHKGRRVFVMQCGFHAYMESWGFVADSPYYAVTNEEGLFKISDIPPGTYKVLVWHPMIKGGAGEEYHVTIKSGETASLEANIQAPTGRLYANQLEENPRFGIEMMGDLKIIPSVELQHY